MTMMIEPGWTIKLYAKTEEQKKRFSKCGLKDDEGRLYYGGFFFRNGRSVKER